MLGRIACFLGLHRVVTAREKPKYAEGPTVIDCFCYRCPWSKRIITSRGAAEQQD